MFSLTAAVALLRSDTLGQRNAGIWKEISYLVSESVRASAT